MPGGLGGFAQRIFFGRDSKDRPSSDVVSGSPVIVTPTTIRGGGFRLSAVGPSAAGSGVFQPGEFHGNLVRLERTGAANEAFAARFPRQLRDLDALRAAVTPFGSDLRTAMLGRLAAAEQRATGNLRENLARRRVLGSSFAQDALSRTEAEFGLARADIEAQVGALELGATQSLLDQERGLISEAVGREIDLLQVATGATLNLMGLQQDQEAIKSRAVNADEQLNLQWMQLTRNVINDIAGSVSKSGAGM